MNALSRSDGAVLSAGALVEAHGLRRVYRRGKSTVEALAAVDLSILPGRFVTVLGPSGCGKSTLLNLLAGFDAPTSGTISIDGQPAPKGSLGRGVVFQDAAALFPWLTVAGNVAFGLKGRYGRKEIRRRVSDALDLVGLAASADSYPEMLSGGMRQLAAIARVLVLEPRFLLMDEPFAALDALTRQTMQAQLVEIWRRTSLSILFITHSVDEALFLGDEVLVMSGRPGRVLKHIEVPMARPRDLTSPALNRLKAEALELLGVKGRSKDPS